MVSPEQLLKNNQLKNVVKKKIIRELKIATFENIHLKFKKSHKGGIEKEKRGEIYKKQTKMADVNLSY